jgi:FtsH-binding integral membrane protein
MNLNVSAAESLNTAVAGVLNRMALGVILTLIIASSMVTLGLVSTLFSSVFGYVVIFAPLAMSLFLAWRGDQLSTGAITGWFFAFATAMGASLSLLFYLFTTASIVQALIGTCVSFTVLAGWGYFTKRDLSGWGPFLIAGVIGLIVASLIGMFFQSSALQMTLNVLTIIIFLGLTAYDMNRIRDMFWNAAAEEVERMQWFGAMSLYINFINIFVSLLQLFGNRE